MTNEKIAEELFPYYEDMEDVELAQTVFKRSGAIEMAEWKDHQFAEEKKKWIEKVIGWIDYNNRNGGCWFDGWEGDLKQAMEE